METSTWKKVVCYVVSFVLVIGMSAGTSFLVAKKQTGVVSAPQAKSAYELAVESGYNGTIVEWLASLVGETGENGKSAYDLAVDNGYDGDVSSWLK